ncbi:MAG: TRAP transporter substrate-binding protein DctP, partial [Oscillospiraceae bacterium]|nr:TRAP transporter substrate-binding protein DctP [Oscillospiraceae bacterium]
FKTILCIVLVIAMAIAICACGNSTPAPSGDGDKPAPAPAPAPSGDKDKEEDKKDEEPAKEEYTDTYVIRVGIADPKPSIYYDNLIGPWEEKVTEYSNGRITFEDYVSGSICGFGSGLDSIRKGTIDVAQDAFGFYTGVYPYCELVNMCGVPCNSLVAFNDMMLDYTKAFPESMDEEFYVFPRYCPVASGFLLTDKIVEHMSDLKGRTLRSTGTVMSFVNATGASGAMVASPDIFESIKLHVIDGAFFSVGGTNTFGCYEVADYFTFLPYYFSENSVSFSREFYNEMDPEAQAAIDKSMTDWKGFADHYCEINDQASLDEIHKSNPNFVAEYMSDECAQEFLEVGLKLMEEKAAEMDAAGLDGTGALEWLKANGPKY